MEDFIDIILILLLVFVVAFTGLLIFLLRTNPPLAHLFMFLFLGSIAAGVGVLGWKIYRKKRLEPYHDILREISRSKKEITRSTRQLDRHLRKVIRAQFPKIRQLCREAKKCIYKITEIDKALRPLEKKQFREHSQFARQSSSDKRVEEKIQESHQRYYENIRTIQSSKNQYLQQVQQVLRFLQELNSQILALKYSQGNFSLQTEIADTIDDLLIEIQTLGEIT